MFLINPYHPEMLYTTPNPCQPHSEPSQEIEETIPFQSSFKKETPSWPGLSSNWVTMVTLQNVLHENFEFFKSLLVKVPKVVDVYIFFKFLLTCFLLLYFPMWIFFDKLGPTPPSPSIQIGPSTPLRWDIFDAVWVRALSVSPLKIGRQTGKVNYLHNGDRFPFTHS